MLKILCPELKLTLLDSLDKRLDFLRDTCEKLGFADVTLVHARAEEPPEGFRESFDYASARAVARLNVLCELCLPYVKPGGAFLAMKGPELDAEVKEAYVALKTLGGTVERQIAYAIPETALDHRIAIIRKTGPDAEKIPPPLGADQEEAAVTANMNTLLTFTPETAVFGGKNLTNALFCGTTSETHGGTEKEGIRCVQTKP